MSRPLPRKPWEIPISYNDEPEPSRARSTDTDPIDYSRGPHDAVLGEEPDDDEPEAPDDPPPAHRADA